MVTISLQSAAFYAAILFTLLGGILGLVGVWIKDFWKNDTALKLTFTNAILASTSIIVAAIAKWLG